MTTARAASAAVEVNRLHQEAIRLAAEAGESLQAAVAMAWHAGQILLEEKKRVRRNMGRGAWLLWLEHNFRGSPRTAQRYMLLARSVTDIAFVQSMSLRTMYARLGIATEPKSCARSILLRRLPPHIGLANRLLGALGSQPGFDDLTAEQRANYRQDLRALYERLRPLFETRSTPAQFLTDEMGEARTCGTRFERCTLPVYGSQPNLRLPG